MKKALIFFVVIVLVFSFQHTKCDESNIVVFDDISESDWYYTAVTELVKNGIISGGGTFDGDTFATRGEIVQSFYNLNRRMGGKLVSDKVCEFTDVAEASPYYDAITWAAGVGLVNGHDDGMFYPEDTCEREQMCAMAIRYFDLCEVKAKAAFGTEQFADSLEVSDFARSYVAAAKLCGLVIGDENGFFNPHTAITKAECASMIYTCMNFQAVPASEGDLISTDADAYTYLYDGYKTVSQYLFNPYVDKSDAVDLSYFDNAVMIGDSVTMSLQFYCAASGALGNVKFLCAGSLSPLNALNDVSSKSLHPPVNGVKMKLEDSVSALGAEKVYVMLGINSLYAGVDTTFKSLESILCAIEEKSPQVKIFVQSVTPMTSDSPIRTDKVNNDKIIEYNEKVLKLCKEKGWYYLNVAEVMKNSDGTLKKDYCSDPKDMGIHLTFAANKEWAEYLKTHVPNDLK